MQTVSTLAQAYAAGDISSEALVDDALAAARHPDGEGSRAFIALDADKIRAQARAADLSRRAGSIPSPLAGLPVSVKDLFDVAGETTAAGSIVLRDAPAARKDAPVIARLRAAGAVLFGRTNLTEFAFSGLGLNPHYDTPRNPYDRATGRIPGGSSAGGAVSVTDAMAVIGLGTDTGGSTRIPAAFCGIVGYKPSRQRIPTDGVFPLSMSLDSVGPMGPSVTCCALCDAVLAGEPALPPAVAELGRMRLAVPRRYVLDDLDEAVARDFERALSKLAAAGARLLDLDMPQLDELAEINRPGGIAPMEAYFIHRDLLARSGERYDPRVRARIEGGAKASAADYLWTLARRRDWIARVGAELAGCDAMLMPTVACIAPALAPLIADEALYRRTNARALRNTSVVNFLDGCALSIPMHRSGSAPTGLMLSGLNGTDARIFSIGVALEQVLRS